METRSRKRLTGWLALGPNQATWSCHLPAPSSPKAMLERCLSSTFALSSVDKRMHNKVLDIISEALFHGKSAASVWNGLRIYWPPDYILSLAVHCNFLDYVRAKLTGDAEG